MYCAHRSHGHDVALFLLFKMDRDLLTIFLLPRLRVCEYEQSLLAIFEGLCLKLRRFGFPALWLWKGKCDLMAHFRKTKLAIKQKTLHDRNKRKMAISG